MADRATGPPGKESSRQGAIRYYTSRVSSLPTEPPAIQPKQTLYLRLLSLSEGPDDEISGISFDLNELLYARLDNEITARAIVKDFLDAKCKGLKDYDFLKEHLLSKGVWYPPKQKGYANRMIKEQQATPLGLDSRWTAENLTDDEDTTPQPPPPSRSPKGKEKEASGRREEGEEIRRLREEFLRERSDMERNMEAMARQMAELRTYVIQSNEELRRSTSAYSTPSIHQSLRNTPIIQELKSPQRPSNPFFKGYT
ncbi:hypothetical protein MBM_00414 [Drepanopeziza brunnea f. sp. 'multigermtubi' MB_m1]|uniref:Uncharacterized protein n=1 Tax=Marssonina brunnea f. sp. multigermtubi (strain MB_m1) TaxID=1072389 RepID=K1X8B3_MARBU|nr:uncharacterized protein MBM_00414 [Drepanopeziza brunnea f. sp. 'multigermtubi' MB_m1]EKD21301.1 hypothetical protein MBM_00414 [Drepanopeziza brunnea f. sp. 'multigermtubi' MB_m1]